MCQFYPNLPPEVDRDERENVLTAASIKLLGNNARILRILIHEKERQRENDKTHVVARFLLAAGWTSQSEANDIGAGSPQQSFSGKTFVSCSGFASSSSEQRSASFARQT